MSGRIPQGFIDQLLARTDLVEVIGARVPLKKQGREFAACCPFHNEKSPSFYVSPSKQFFHCFGCGAHGNAIGFLMDYEHLAFPEAVEELARSAGIEVPREGGSAAAGQQDQYAEILHWLARADQWFRQQLRHHPERARPIEYLRGRGLAGALAAEFGIGYAPPERDALLQALLAEGATRKLLLAAGLVAERDGGTLVDRFRGRVMFPIRDRRGRTIAFGGRVLGDGQPKYLNSPETPVFHKGRELYGLYEARMAARQIGRLVVVEGYMDVVMLAQHGLRCAVATLGTSTTAEHAEKLFRITHDIVFCFDGDRAGREAAWRALENVLPQVRDGRRIGFLFLPDGEDPDSLVQQEGAEAFAARLDGALPLTDYLAERLRAQVNLKTDEGAARLMELAKPLLERMPDSPARDLLVQALDRGSVLRRHTRLQQAPAGVGEFRRKVDYRKSPVRHAIALLLAEPALAAEAGERASYARIDAPGVDLLLELIDIFRDSPHLPAGAAVERYRGTARQRPLERLLAWAPEVPANEFDWQQEFRDTLARIRALGDRRRQLMDRLARGERLEAEELDWLRSVPAGNAGSPPQEP